MVSFVASAHTVMERCDILGGYSEEPDRLTRRYGTAPMRQANEAVSGWMRAAGMQVQRDAVGNLIGRYEADTTDATDATDATGAPTLLLGSHLDTVRDAGKYDGPLGVIVALACVARLHAYGDRLPFAVEVVAFADEEGLRFHTAYLGSAAYAGTLDPTALTHTDGDGTTVAEAIRAFGGDPDAIAIGVRQRDNLLGYCEVHIEQGPVLEAQGLPLGVVSSIQGQTRVALAFSGVAGHAGTVPMSLRHDALSAASEFVLATEAYARGTPELVATVGQLGVDPGASNVIPGRVTLSLDVRHPVDDIRERAIDDLKEHGEAIAGERGVLLQWQPVSASGSVPCSPRLADMLALAVGDCGRPALRLASGAGHDAVSLAALTEIAMLFVRCKGGVSHSPAESVEQADVAFAVEALERFIRRVAGQGDAG